MGHWGWVAGGTSATFHFVTEVALGTLDRGWVALHALGNALAVYILSDSNNSNNASLLLFDNTNPLSPSLQSTTAPIGAHAEGSAKIIGTNLYLSASSKLGVYDITNLASPTLSGDLLLTGTLGISHAFTLSGSTYMVADRSVGAVENVSVYDVTTPSSITLVGATGNLVTFNSGSWGYGTTFYAQDDIPSTLYVVDNSTPSSPTVASTIVVTGGADLGSASAINMFCQRAGSGFIRSYDVSNIASPSFGSEFKCDDLDSSPFAVGLFTDGTYLYSVNLGGRYSVTMKNMTNLAAEVEIGNVLTQHSPTSSNPVCTIGITTYVITNDGSQNYLEIYQYS